MFKAFFLVLLLAGGLRFTALSFDSLWLDENYQTVVESYGNSLPDLLNHSGKPFLFKPKNPASVKEVLLNFRKVDPLCPPLFAVLMNRWLTIFGGSDISLRVFPALCSILSIIAIYLFGSALLGRSVGLYAAMFQAISPFDIGYAQEARMYSLCSFLAILSGGSLLQLCLKNRSFKDIALLILYIISTAALINTHYTQIFLWAFTVFIAFAVAISRKDWQLLGAIILSTLSILALSLPWTDLFLQAASLRKASFYVARQANLWWPIWALLVRIPFNWLTFLSGKKVMFWAIPVYLTSLILLARAFFVLINYIKTVATKKINKSMMPAIILKQPLTLLFLWALVPTLMVWALDVIEIHRVTEIPRYLISTAPAVFLLAGCGLYSFSLINGKQYFISLATCHAIFCLANNAYQHLVPQKENWRQIAHLVDETCRPSEIIFVSNYYDIVCLDRYLQKPQRQIGISPAIGASIIESRINTEKTALNPAPTFWVLAAQEGDRVFDTISNRYKLIQKYDFPHALHLRQYRAD